MSTCSRCGRPIIWALTRNGKNMPFEQWPDERYGSFLLLKRADGLYAVHQARATDEEKHEHGFPRYQSHYEACPNPKYPPIKEAV